MIYRVSGAARDGAYIHGLFMEGARWDAMQGVIMESKLKELFPEMPVINVRVGIYIITRLKLCSKLTWSNNISLNIILLNF